MDDEVAAQLNSRGDYLFGKIAGFMVAIKNNGSIDTRSITENTEFTEEQLLNHVMAIIKTEAGHTQMAKPGPRLELVP